MFGIVLYQPEIPSNTGNIGRTCLNTNSTLHLIEPLGFTLNDRYLKRAGMDYWDRLSVTRYLDYADFLEKQKDARLWYITTKGEKCYTEADFQENDFLMFGQESAGIPEELLREHRESCLRIPMAEGCRSLNLANSVAIVLYEALRQIGFPSLSFAPRKELW